MKNFLRIKKDKEKEIDYIMHLLIYTYITIFIIHAIESFH